MLKEQSADSIEDSNASQPTTKDDSIISDLLRDNACEEPEREKLSSNPPISLTECYKSGAAARVPMLEPTEATLDIVVEAECDVLDRDDLEDEEEDAGVPTSFHEIIRRDLDAYILEIKQQVQEKGPVAKEPKIDLTLRESEIAEVSAQDFFDISR